MRRCNTCQKRLRKGLEQCPYCGGRIKQPNTGVTQMLTLPPRPSIIQLQRPAARKPRPYSRKMPHIRRITLDIWNWLTLPLCLYIIVWMASWSMRSHPSGPMPLHDLVDYAGLACLILLPFTLWKDWPWRSFFLICAMVLLLIVAWQMP